MEGEDDETEKDKEFELETWVPTFKENKPNPIKKENFLRMVICGPSDSGKSFLLKYLGIKYFRRIYETIVVFCGSEDTLKEYGKVLKTEVLYKHYEPKYLDTIKKNQRELVAKGKPMLKILIIYDDQFTRKNNKDDSIFQAAIGGRHDAMGFCMVLHDLVLTDRVVRDQLTHLILTRQTNYDVFENVVKQFLVLSAWKCPKLPLEARQSKRKLISYLVGLLQDSTKNYNVIVILLEAYKKNQEAEFSDFLKIYKAGPLPRI